MARLIRKHTKKRVCCIGDGGNDVSMIQAAHVGIGISGVEVSVVDFGISPALTHRLGFASCPVGRCRHFTIPLLKKAAIGTWSLELSPTVKIDPLYVQDLIVKPILNGLSQIRSTKI